MSRGWLIWLVLASWSWLGLSGCGMLAKKIESPQESYVAASNDFMKRLRWKDFQGAAKYFVDEEKEPFLEQLRRIEKDLNITDVRLESAEYLEQSQTMETWLVLEYFRLPSPTVKHLRFAQQWKFSAAGENAPRVWRIVSNFPSLTED